MKPFTYFVGPSVRELYDRLGAVDLDTARLEIHEDGDDRLLRVVSADNGDVAIASHLPDINDSHRCPPDCTGGG